MEVGHVIFKKFKLSIKLDLNKFWLLRYLIFYSNVFCCYAKKYSIVILKNNNTKILE